MSNIDLKALQAIKFVTDQVLPGGQIQEAYKLNHEAICQVLNFLTEDKVPILAMTAGRSEKFPVTKSKYKSALWVWYWFYLNGGRCSVIADGLLMRISFKMTPAARISAKQYFGESVCEDARNNENTIHTFVREILFTGDVEVSFECAILS